MLIIMHTKIVDMIAHFITIDCGSHFRSVNGEKKRYVSTLTDWYGANVICIVRRDVRCKLCRWNAIVYEDQSAPTSLVAPKTMIDAIFS